MSGDIGELFERSAQDMEMRPEFRARLVELYEESLDDLQAVTPRSASSPDLIEPASAKSSWQKQRRSRVWLLVAATVVVVVGLATLERRRSTLTARSGKSVATSEVADRGACQDPEQLGVVASGAAELRVGLRDDGQTFCLGLNPSIGVSEGDELPIGLREVVAAPSTPQLLEAGPGPSLTRSYYYLFAIPEYVPLAEVRGENPNPPQFISRVGRRLIILDTDVDERSTAKVAHLWKMYSAAGSYLGTLTADGPPSRPQASESSGSVP